VSRSIINRVVQSGQPLLTNDAALDGRFSLSESVVLRKIKSVICVPVRQGDALDSVLYVHSSAVEHGLSTEDLELATAVAFQLSAHGEARHAVERERRLLESLVGALVTALEAGDPRGSGHSQRVADYAGAIAAQMGQDEEEVHRVRIAGLVHDVGKAAVRREQPDASAEEVRRRHVQAAERILTGIEGFERVLPAVRYHHEKADGSGFPYGVKNADLPLSARILAIANAFTDACDGGRDPKEVVRDLVARAGKDFDAEVADALALCHRNGSLFGGREGRA
jgi:putative nucleotidyltransferase with HDIG domain